MDKDFTKICPICNNNLISYDVISMCEIDHYIYSNSNIQYSGLKYILLFQFENSLPKAFLIKDKNNITLFVEPEMKKNLYKVFRSEQDVDNYCENTLLLR